MKKWLIILSSILLIADQLSAQIQIRFNAAIHGNAVQGLSMVQVINNTGSEFKGNVEIRVGAAFGKRILDIRTAQQVFRPGVNVVENQAFSRAQVSYGSHEEVGYVRQTGRLPEGELEYCFNVVVSESKDPNLTEFEQCFTHVNQPFTPLLLVNPVDGEESCNLRPNFLWQPPIPVPTGAQFRLTLTEIVKGQDAVRAISYGTPVIVQQGLNGNMLIYPSILPDLKKDAKYAWQVIMYAGSTALARSEVWEFSTTCIPSPIEEDVHSYRELKEGSTGEFLIANTYLKFAVRNAYSTEALSYQIVSMKSQASPLKGLPKLVMKNGLNTYKIDLDGQRGFVAGEEYLLTVLMKNGVKLKLRFLYTHE
jgi:hypothetical protein